jgi:non-heme chloroperoxidase
MLFFLARAIASSPMTGAAMAARPRPTTGNDMDTYAADVAALAKHLDLKDAIHIGHSTGGGEVARYVARAGEGPGGQGRADRRRAADHGQVRQANPGGLPIEVFDGFRAGWRQPRAVLPSMSRRPVLRLQPAGREGLQGVIDNWWRQGMMGGAKAHYDCIKAFSETDFTEDLKKIDGAGAGDARRGRPDRARSPIPPRCRPSC